MPKLLLASNNPSKLEELRSLLVDLPRLELLAPADLAISLEVPEDGKDYTENAALKAKAFAEASGLPALADDSGLEVEALGGGPGLHSARIAPTAAERRALLLSWLAGKPQPWNATFRSTICLALPGGETHYAVGECRGQISPVERGQGGFGYDPIFIVEGLGKTMAELSPAEKNRLSHRARAVEKIRVILTRIYG
ncbi:MAG: RdgB/HAM1 family non-canonical purine NTP pyrophosphatase [Anaerolineales bacterium]